LRHSWLRLLALLAGDPSKQALNCIIFRSCLLNRSSIKA
jgi:hypothetical protein